MMTELEKFGEWMCMFLNLNTAVKIKAFKLAC